MSLVYHRDHLKRHPISAWALPPRRIIRPETLNRFNTAISAGDWEDFDTCLAAFGPDREFKVKDLYPVLPEAIKQDSVIAVERLLSCGLILEHGWAQDAIYFKAKRCLESIIKRWDINTPISNGDPTVLGYAVEDEEMALWLIDHGADLNKQTYIDLTPMSYAVLFATPALIEKFLDLGGDVHTGELLQYALDRKTDDIIDVLRILIDRGAPLGAIMYEKHAASMGLFFFMDLGTPLHKAAKMGKTDVVQFLLERKADPTIRNIKGQTPEECAVKYGFLETAELLRSVSTN